MGKVYEDVKIAECLILGKKIKSNGYDSSGLFSKYSAVYRTTNEHLNKYAKYLEKCESILSVTASGDQILTAAFYGTKEVDTFDISHFPSYFLALKFAAIMGLTHREFLDFFYSFKENKCHNEWYFTKIRPYLDKKNAYFWNCILEKFPWNHVYNSNLFQGPTSKKWIYEKNKYLEVANFMKLKQALPQVKLNFQIENIYDLSQNLTKTYDLIYLSNIIDYSNVEAYFGLIEALKRRVSGLILTYSYGFAEVLKSEAWERDYSFETYDSGHMLILTRC